MTTLDRSKPRLTVVGMLALLLIAPKSILAQGATPAEYVPPELQVSDVDVKAFVDSGSQAARNGSYDELVSQLQRALELCVKKGFVADKAIVEEDVAAAYFAQGKLDEAKKHWLSALSDGVEASNLVLQADVLVALSSLSQAGGNQTAALDLMNRASDLARRSKNLYVLARALGELGRLQLAAGKKADARASVEEALRIDRLNKYDWEASHLLYLGWITSAESEANLDKMLELEKAARDLAIQKDNYIVFLQAVTTIGQTYVRKGQVSAGIDILEHAQSGTSERGEPLFKRPDSYRAAMALPFLRVVLLEALATAYQTGQRPAEALKTWQQLYDTGKAAGFTLAAAEAAHAMAEVYSARKEYGNAISYYSLAAEAWAAGGNEQRRVAALTSEAALLSQQGQKDKALQLDEEVLPLAKASKNVPLQFILDLAVAELLAGTEKLDRVDSALKDAEPLVTPDLTVPGVGPSAVVELYIRLADLYRRQNDFEHELVALEKALTPATALATAPGTSKNEKPFAWLMAQLQAKIDNSHLRETAEKAYAGGEFRDALLYFELLQWFDGFDAARKGKYEEYTKGLDNDPDAARLIGIPSKVIAEADGVAFLADNLHEMGPVAGGARLPSLMALTDYYMLHQRPHMVVQFVTEAQPYLKLGENDTPSRWDVVMACDLAYSLMLEKDLKSAVEKLTPCMTSARKLGNPGLLREAHQVNVWVLEAAGKHQQAQESAQFLLNQSPDDPREYAQLAQLRAQQGDRSGAADAWRKTVQLFEARHDLNGAAAAHMALADSLRFEVGANPEEQRRHLEVAAKLYGQLGNREGEVQAEASLGAYFASKKDTAKARRCFEEALKIAVQAKTKGLEASVLSQTGQAYESWGDWTQAVEEYGKSADTYRELNDRGDEAFQLRNRALGLHALHRPEEALETIMRAETAADASGSWAARYWVRRSLAGICVAEGQYQCSLTASQEAKEISDSANQPLNSAWAALDLSGVLEVIGSWDEALEQVNSALPALRQFKDLDDEALAYQELVGIYGARESEIKDLGKALEFHQLAYQLVARIHPERAAGINLDLVEIYWDSGRFKDAITKASEALEYYRQQKNELGEASALISLAEAERSDGDLPAAAQSLQLAEPLVLHTNDFYTTGRLYYSKAGLLRKEGRFKEAIEQYERVIELLERFKSSADSHSRTLVSETYSFIYDDLIDAYYSVGATDRQYAVPSAAKALEYAELNKSRAFASSWGQAISHGLKSQVPVHLQERERRLLARRASLESELQESMAGAGHRSVEEVKNDLDSAGKDESEMVQELRTASPAYAEARYPQPVILGEVPLRPDEILVEFKMLKDSVAVWMVGGSAGGAHLVAFYKVDRPRQWFEKRIFSLRDAFNTGHPERFEAQTCEELFTSLFPEPFAQHLEAARSVVFVPDDILFLIPFEVLSPGASQGKFVLLNTATEYFPSAAAFRLARAVLPTRPVWQEQFIGIADPVTSPDDERYVAATVLSEPNVIRPESAHNGAPGFRGISVEKIQSRGFALERIPETATEVKSIASLFPGSPSPTELRTGVAATKQGLIQTDLTRFRFVHFATHGILPVEAGIKEPALVLSYEGTNKDSMLLTVSEVFQLKLHADMVVLSACNTGSGRVTKAEGVASLGTAFLAAGASSATVSLWHVADKSTAILMQEFYRNLLKGMPKAASLAAARSSLVSQGYDNPFFWAPFVLTGE
jgi:CHAT domain-containing protein/tetratricopeptide (TPR) repeat protein